MKFSVHMIDENGKGCYLSFKGRTEWKTLRTARKHAADMEAVKQRLGYVIVEIENEFGEVVR